MQSEKSLATAAESSSVDDASIDMDPRPGRPSTEHSTGPSHMRRQSQASLRSESHTRPPISCVSRGSMSGDDCARQRFIVWAAVKRNSSVRMAASDRLRCPLIRCGERFGGHEEMLRHLTQCQHLSTGEYVCYECMKVERFNDKKCTCCIGQPTKRRRIINMAKNFFSNIGSAKVRRENSSPSMHNNQSSPPSYDSLVDMHRQFSQAQMEEPAPREERVGESDQSAPEQPQLELNGTELLELDSTPLLPTAELDAVNYDTHLTNMLGPLDSCAETRETSLSPMPGIISKPRQSPSLSTMLQLNTETSGSGRRPSLALNTQIDHYRTKPHTAYLSPSSSFRTSSNGISPITPWSTSSKSSALWSTASGRDTMLASPITPLSADVHPTAPQEDRVVSTEKDIDMLACPEDPCRFMMGDVPELPGDNQLSSAIPRLLSDPLMFYDPNDNYSWLSSMNTEISLSTSVNMMFTDQNAKTAMPRDFLGSQISGSEAKALVEQVWDALGEHFSNSVSKLSRLQHNPLAGNFRAYSQKRVAIDGLMRFRKILDHNYSTRPDPLEYLCFVHLIYSISLVMYEDNLIARSNKFYEQAIAYSSLFDAAHRDDYYQIVTTIWQQNSQESTSRGRVRDSMNRPTGNKGKEPDYQASSMPVANPDRLVITGQNFLDELENIMVNGNIQQPLEVVSSELWSSHLTSNQPNLQGSDALTIASAYLVQDLCRTYHDSENFLPKLTAIGQNARAGYYATIRKLELELIQTGKKYFTSNDFLDQYMIQVRDLCDQIYAQSGTRPRAEYHLLGISLVNSLVQSIAREPQQPQQGHSEYPPFPYPYEEFLGELKTFNWDYPMIPTTQQPDFGTQLDLSTLHADPSHLPMRSDASETPSDSYTVSPAPLSDAPPDIPASKSYRPTPPTQIQGEGSETSRPSILASSGQKVEASERCEICGYRPKGDPQWFKGSMAKHKKMQHSTNPPVIYKCPFPGCNSEYKNRRDNLRQHQIEKNHFVGDERQIRRKRKERN